MPDAATSPWPPATATTALAVLVSGGLDSAILLAEAAAVYPVVYPIFVRVGSVWEDAEFAHLTRFLAAIRRPSLRPCVVLAQPVADVYGPHWSITGKNVPRRYTPDEDVFLPGRNVLLLAKPLLWCHLNGVPEIATAPLAGNPFPDATPKFYDDFARVVTEGVNGNVRVLRPYADQRLHKADVLLRGRHLPLQHTLSCIEPADGVHCGACSKCGERIRGFADVGLPDPTDYVASRGA